MHHALPLETTPMKFYHRFTVAAPWAEVADFHRRSTNMRTITPPPIVVQVHRAPAQLAEGDQMEFTLWLGPLPVRWLAHFEQITPISFVDAQRRGPFARWDHLHLFLPRGDHHTDVIDELTIELSAHPLWKLVGFGMWLGLPLLFAYRAWATRRALGQGHRAHAGR
jgi:ligand-binding SRPBCC domain-containing protein